MNKRTNELAFKYNINASVDELSLFVSEIYNDGYFAGKETQLADATATLRDHFAGLAMQALVITSPNGSRIITVKDAYQMADAMLKASEVGDE